MKITVIDSIMGSGKTTWAIKYMNEAPADQKFIYITPFLGEVERVKKGVNARKIVEPNKRNGEGTKLRSLKEMIASGYDIASTHALFRAADDELITLLEESEYTLILDEVMSVVERAEINKADIQALLDSGLIRVEESTSRVVWVDSGYESGRFQDIKMLSNAGNLYKFGDNLLLWTFPPRVFAAFQESFVMTYLFEAQIQRCYFDLFSLEYTKKSVRNGELVQYDSLLENRQEIYKLIDIYEGPLNEIGEKRIALSSTRLKNYGSGVIKQIKNNLYNYIRNHIDAKGDEVIWTTLKSRKDALKGKGFAKSFIEWNIRATNEYGDRSTLAFIYNRFIRPEEKAFFETRPEKITVDENLLAVSDLLQWIWRSRIRNGQPINLYLPSSRMRSLLKAWANYEI
ncbi:hypothetical protein ABES25_04675 [Bacillus gobiensis]|uniref:hypothetical protein n=1 Tax=Bacillus gobiensis TaxID=1441095 RepID=UPI003D20833A